METRRNTKLEPLLVAIVVAPFTLLFAYFLVHTYLQPADLTCYEDPSFCNSNY